MSQPTEEHRTAASPLVSVVVPVKNEAGNIRPLVTAIRTSVESLSVAFEIIYVDDGSTDSTRDEIRTAIADLPALRGLSHEDSCGQSAALNTGIRAARGSIIATLDGDGQNPPEELPKLIGPFLDPDVPAELGMVCGQRVAREDTMWKKLGSRVANGVRQAILKDGVRDTGCGLKAFRRDVYLGLPYFDHLHRFMPAIMRREGYDIMLVDVRHQARMSGRSNYGNLDRALVGLVDLVGVAWLLRRRRLPTVRELK